MSRTRELPPVETPGRNLPGGPAPSNRIMPARMVRVRVVGGSPIHFDGLNHRPGDVLEVPSQVATGYGPAHLQRLD